MSKLSSVFRAIELDPTNAVYYCNRCAVHNKLENFQAAIEDANKAIQIDPSYGKAYGRLGYVKTARSSVKLDLVTFVTQFSG